MSRRIVIALTVVAGLSGTGLAMAAGPPKPAAPAKPGTARSTHSKAAGGAPAARRAQTPAAAAVPAPRNNTWALLVGVSKYQNPAILSLRFPASDATAARDALVDRQLGGLPSGSARLLTDEEATTAKILGAVDDFLKPNVKPGDQVIVFLAGHGVAKGVGLEAKSFFLSTDIKGLTTPALEATAVDLKVLSEKLSEVPAAKFVGVFDACREDPTLGRGVQGNIVTDG